MTVSFCQLCVLMSARAEWGPLPLAWLSPSLPARVRLLHLQAELFKPPSLTNSLPHCYLSWTEIELSAWIWKKRWNVRLAHGSSWLQWALQLMYWTRMCIGCMHTRLYMLFCYSSNLFVYILTMVIVTLHSDAAAGTGTNETARCEPHCTRRYRATQKT